jgi:signal peptide peptidase SppA
MLRQALLIAEAMTTPWAIIPERIRVISLVLARWQAGRLADPGVLAEIRADARARAQRGSGQNVGGIQVLPLHGMVVQRAPAVEDVSGGGTVSTQMFTQALRAALADDAVDGIIIDVDSPGGSVFGVGELADEIYAARGSKPIYAVANSCAASAAYWIAASAAKVFATPGGEVGSIGVFAAHEDLSRALDAEGVKTTLISAGKYKTEGNAYEPLTPEAKAAVQDRVDSYYGQMTRDIARGRGAPVDSVRNGMGQGRIVGANKAVQMGMVDGIGTLDQVVGQMARDLRAGTTGPRSPAGAFSGSSDQARLRAEARRRELEIWGPVAATPPKSQAQLRSEARRRALDIG